MTYSFDGRTYTRFRDLFYSRFDVSLSELTAPPLMHAIPVRAQPPLGYVCIGEGDARSFVPNSERTKLIALAFLQVTNETNFQKVWRTVVANALSGCRISASGLLHILRNPAYLGLMRYGQELYAGGLDPIICEAFKAAVRELDRHTMAFHDERLLRLEKFHRDLAGAKAIEQDRR